MSDEAPETMSAIESKHTKMTSHTYESITLVTNGNMQ